MYTKDILRLVGPEQHANGHIVCDVADDTAYKRSDQIREFKSHRAKIGKNLDTSNFFCVLESFRFILLML